ncbi:uncharacterized protein LY89DRAFT_790342 [Mollisia scopiformis]|uniref:Uncharacterized protein n=1 Tax=Mollisia scopiformis TaxID=149040 RepID=A0A132B4U7_MOLSC|nr:uncharacterized protein LY89DRAFT_790342 [Mollisia scopiformis]KUJ06697.1 hypothetical protein LY89DRAFT_790342 [Mollisia scopiformis]
MLLKIMYSRDTSLIILGVFFSIVALVHGGKMQLMNTPLLATFYPEESYAGFPFKIHAFYDSCYNFHGLVESVTLGKVTEYCDVYAVMDCGENEEKTSYRSITEPTPRMMDKRDGLAVPGLGAIKSMRCYLDEAMVKEQKEDLK